MVSTEVNPFKVDIKVQPTDFKNEIDEINHEITEGINAENKGTKWGQTTTAITARRFNTHPCTATDMSQRRFILKKCRAEGFKWFNIKTKIYKI